MDSDRVLITGMGALTPLGLTIDTTWQSLLAGRSGIERIIGFDPTGYPVQIAGEVRGFDPASIGFPKDARRMDRSVQLAISATQQAVADAAFEVTDPVRTAVIVGSAIGGIGLFEHQAKILAEKGPTRVAATFLPNTLIDTSTSYIATMLGATGPNFAVVAACATGSHALGVGADLIRRGLADVVIAGGTEACVTPLVHAGFCQMRALSARNDEPHAASRPFDRARSGFVVAEGAAIVVLERESHARARGARVHAELAGFGASNDAYHVATPHPESRGVIQMLRAALEDAHLSPEQVGYLNAHGTGTPLGDVAETAAIKAVFGDHVKELPVSSTKSMTGHLFGAAGALEAIISALALRDQILPPTINLDDPDPVCDLDYVPHTAREVAVEAAVSSSMGLGGHNGALVLRRWHP